MPTIQLKDGNGELKYFSVSGSGTELDPYIPLSDLGSNPLPTQGISDGFLRRLFRTLSRLSFDVSGQLRTAVAGTVAISSGTVTTVTTMATGNIGMGDMGKPATAMIMSRLLVVNGTQRNLRRS